MSDMFSRPDVDARLKGAFFGNIPTGTHDLEYVFDFDCQFNGAAIWSSVSNGGSFIRLETQYDAGPYGWKRYKKFGDSWNLFPNYVCKTILFPTEPSAGVKLLIRVTNNEGAPIDLGINLFQFTESQKVNPGALEEGDDW